VTTITRFLTDYELDILKASHAEVVAKAAKLGVPAPTYRLTGNTGFRTDEFGFESLPVTEVEYETFPVRYEGYKFLAVVDHAVGIVTAGPDAPEGIVAEYVGSEPVCDACGYDRDRNHSIVVVHEDGHRLRVGGSCAKDYIGNLSLKSYASFVRESDDLFGGSTKSETIVPTAAVVAIAHRAITLEGYVPASAEDRAPTKSTVNFRLFPPLTLRDSDREFLKELTPTAEDYEVAKKAIEYARALPGDNDFELNLKAIVAKDEFDVAGRGFGLLVYVAEGYRRSLAKAAEAEAKAKAEANKAPAPIGKTKVTGVVTTVKVVYNDYGSTTKFRDDDDSGFAVWSTVPRAILGAEIGDRVEFTATLTPSEDDKFFAFASHPSKATIIESAVSA